MALPRPRHMGAHWVLADENSGSICTCHIGRDHDVVPDPVRARLAQLELIAERGRKACAAGVLVSKHWDSPGTDASVQKVLDALWVLDMALVDLDHHPDTRP